MIKLSKFAGVVLSAMALTACASTPDSPFGPWVGFIYKQVSSTEEVRTVQGEYKTLTSCMEHMQVYTKYSHYAYYCGYDCKGIESGSLSCEKIAGSPLSIKSAY